MLLKHSITLLLATLAAAVLGKPQPQLNLGVKLTNTILAATEELKASMDGTAVAVDSTSDFDLAEVKCIDLCIPEFHCTLYDRNISPFITLPPGKTHINPAQQVGLIICGSGMPGDRPAATEARATEPYSGVAVFSNDQICRQNGFGYQLG